MRIRSLERLERVLCKVSATYPTKAYCITTAEALEKGLLQPLCKDLSDEFLNLRAAGSRAVWSAP